MLAAFVSIKTLLWHKRGPAASSKIPNRKHVWIFYVLFSSFAVSVLSDHSGVGRKLNELIDFFINFINLNKMSENNNSELRNGQGKK